MEPTLKMYRCECGGDVYEEDTNCVGCNKPVDPALLVDTPESQKQAHRVDRRVRKVIIHPMIVQSWVTDNGKRFTVKDNPLPPDAKNCGAGYDYYQNGFVLFVSSKEFDFVPDGESAPTHNGIAITQELL